MASNAARLKDCPPVPLETLDQVDATLRRLCEIDAELKAREAKLSLAVTRAKSRAEDRAQPLLAERDALVRSLSRYAEDHQGEICQGRVKSVQLTHGKLGFRSEAGKLKLQAATKEQAEELEARAVEALEREHPEAVKVEKKVLLAPLRKLGAEVYEPLGFRLVGARDVAYAEPDKAQVENLFAKLAPAEAVK